MSGQPWEPQEGEIVIDVSGFRARARWCKMGERAYGLEPATNWRRLESAALRIVERHGASVTQTAIYHCPASLAMWAEWADDGAEIDV